MDNFIITLGLLSFIALIVLLALIVLYFMAIITAFTVVRIPLIKKLMLNTIDNPSNHSVKQSNTCNNSKRQSNQGKSVEYSVSNLKCIIWRDFRYIISPRWHTQNIYQFYTESHNKNKSGSNNLFVNLFDVSINNETNKISNVVHDGDIIKRLPTKSKQNH